MTGEKGVDDKANKESSNKAPLSGDIDRYTSADED